MRSEEKKKTTKKKEKNKKNEEGGMKRPSLLLPVKHGGMWDTGTRPHWGGVVVIGFKTSGIKHLILSLSILGILG